MLRQIWLFQLEFLFKLCDRMFSFQQTKRNA